MPRKVISDIANAHIARGDATGWFEVVYKAAAGDNNYVPWADQKAHIFLKNWLEGREFGPIKALDVGCGLGDNAEALSASGMQVTAFDISPTAIEWVRKRFPETRVDYVAADLFHLPERWQGQFDFINEIYTLQALPVSIRPQAIAEIAGLLAPGGTLLVICRGREAHQHSDGPPWALSADEIMMFENHGLKRESFERFDAYDNSSWSRFRFVFTA